MPHRILLLLGVLTLVGCRNNTEGAVKLTVSYIGFKPGCIRVAVKDAAGASAPRTTELSGKGTAAGGRVTVAAFQEAGWSPTLALTAEAFETQCQGTPLRTVSQQVTVSQGQVAEVALKLVATDSDGDGYVSRADNGTDCDDARLEAHPGATELCNGRDDNCDTVRDEGFEVGALCNAADGCVGAWTCTAPGARTCEARPGQWHPDADKDGKGSRQSTGVTNCQQPPGHVANNLDCDDANPRRYVGAPELCNTVDDNCDGTADDGLDVGAACTGAGGCGGQRACATDGGVVCNSPTPTLLYPDNDKDTRGAADAGVSSCEPTRPGHVSNANDCDDTRANVYVGARELCDGLDNDCDSTPDEDFNLGTSCNPGLGCPGATACATDGGTRCDFTTSPSTYYPDDDLDQHGKADAGVLTCVPDAGHILQAGDCNDGNPFSHADARELCDLEDNDCDGAPEAAEVCPGGNPAWVAADGGDTTTVWRTVELWGDGGVWVAGEGGRRARKRPTQSSFASLSSGCVGDWQSLWVDPSTGRAYLGGLAGKLGIQERDSTSCTVGPPSAGDSNTRGLWGTPAAGGGLELHGVGTNGGNGRVFRWDGGVENQSVTAISSSPLYDVHGLSPELLFAVGGPDTTPHIYRFSPDAGTWGNAQPATTGLDGLNAVWVVHPTLAFAVGENRSVMRWDGQAWSAHPTALSLAATGEDLSGVVAFGEHALYVVSRSGNVFSFDGQSWRKLHSASGTMFYDIAGTSPEDLWVVGDNGRILHWPR